MKKALKIIGIALLTLTVVTVVVIKRDTVKIYGGLTHKVDHQALTPATEDYYITNAHILHADGDTFTTGQTLQVVDGIITAIDTLALDPNIKTYDAQGKYLIPGLIDSHVHLFKSENDLLLYVANGVTQIREMIGEPDHITWKNEIADGRLGPDMYVTSPRLGSFGALEGWFMSYSQGFDNVSTVEEAKNYVQSAKEKGYDGIKIYSHLNKESYDAISDEIVHHDLDMVGHIPWFSSWDDILTSNQNEIAHVEEVMNAYRREFGDVGGRDDEFLEYIRTRTQEIAPQLIKKDISVTTTVWLAESFYRQKIDLDAVLRDVALEYENPGISEWNKMIPVGIGWLPEVNRYKVPEGLNEEEAAGHLRFFETYSQACTLVLTLLHEEGVNILAGTDANLPPTVPGFSLHDELISMQAAGMTPAEVLRSATKKPAEWLDIDAGVIDTGMKANMVLLDRNPLEDISNTKTISKVFLNGRTLERSQLDDILTTIRSANDKSRSVDIDEFL